MVTMLLFHMTDWITSKLDHVLKELYFMQEVLYWPGQHAPMTDSDAAALQGPDMGMMTVGAF